MRARGVVLVAGCISTVLACTSEPGEIVAPFDPTDGPKSQSDLHAPGDTPDLELIRDLAPLRAEKARRHLETLLGFENGVDLIPRNVRVDSEGTTQVRMIASYGGVPIRRMEHMAHATPEGTVARHLAPRLNLEPDLLAELDVIPTLSADDAVAIVLDDLGHDALDGTPAIELVIHPRTVRALRSDLPRDAVPNATDVVERVVDYQLAYYVTATVHSPRAREWSYAVDAHSGAVIGRLDVLGRGDLFPPGFNPLPPPNAHTQHSGHVHVAVTYDPDEQVYRLYDPGRGKGHLTLDDLGNRVYDRGGGWGTFHDPGIAVYESPINSWGDGRNFTTADYDTSDTFGPHGQTAAVDVYYGMQVVWDLLLNVFGREGLTGEGHSLAAYVHLVEDNPIAYWSQQHRAAVFLDPPPDGLQATSPATVGHEFAHGLFRYILNPTGTPDGLLVREFRGVDEANGDILGMLTQFYETLFPYGAGSTIPEVASDWVFGDCSDQGRCRFLYKPSKHGGFDAWAPEINDEDVSPHDASGPISRMFYFLSQGARTPQQDPERSSEFLPRGFQGIGTHQAARIWYRAIDGYFLHGGDFLTLREACLAAAETLHGKYSLPYKAVQDAFAAVNVGPPADRDPPAVTLDDQRTDTTLTLVIRIEDESDIAELSWTMSGLSRTGTTRSFGGVFSDPGPVNYVMLPMADVRDFTYAFTATAADVTGNVRTESRIIDVIPPWKVSMEDLPGEDLFRRRLEIEVADDRAPSHVAFFRGSDLQHVDTRPSNLFLDPVGANCGSDQGCTPEWPSHTFNWAADMRGWPTGWNVVRAVAYDAAGNTEEVALLHWEVDNDKPEITLYVAPTGVHGRLKLGAIITDYSPIVSARFEVNQSFLCTRQGNHPACYFDSTTVPNGIHELAVTAHDAWGNWRTERITFTVDNQQSPDDGGGSTPSWYYEVEPNNSTAAANPVPLSARGVRGALSSHDDQDYFRVPVPPGSAVTTVFEVLGGYSGCYLKGTMDFNYWDVGEDVFVQSMNAWGRRITNNTTSTVYFYYMVRWQHNNCSVAPFPEGYQVHFLR